MPKKKGAQLDIADREYIEEALKNAESFRKIASHLGVSPTTVSNEVKNNRILLKPKRAEYLSYTCARYKDCRMKNLCGDCRLPYGYCRFCKKVRCTLICPNYDEITCDRRESAPYVCYGCKEKGCHIDQASIGRVPPRWLTTGDSGNHVAG